MCSFTYKSLHLSGQHYLHLALRLRMSGAIPPLPRVSSCCAQGKLYFKLYSSSSVLGHRHSCTLLQQIFGWITKDPTCWSVTPCSLTNRPERCGRNCCLHFQRKVNFPSILAAECWYKSQVQGNYNLLMSDF
jgi:hypothetical protein